MGNYITYICLPKQPFHLQEVLIWVCLCMCGCVLKCVWVCMGVSVYYVQILHVLTYYLWFHCSMCNGFFVLLCFLLGCLLFSVQCCSIMLSHVLNKEMILIRKQPWWIAFKDKNIWQLNSSGCIGALFEQNNSEFQCFLSNLLFF